ncbi:MAG: hypothetical protein FJW96_05295 [Actinobacteria bacterium]|nr:hypothetical protein [Actinomycetota bacterium]
MARDHTPNVKGDAVDLARLLVLLQGALLVLSSVEVAIWGVFSGGLVALGPTAIVTVASAALTLWLAAALGARRRHARRVVLVGEGSVLLFALVDLGLALAFLHRPLELVSLLTRLVLPVAVIWLLRRPAARVAFARRPKALGTVS